MLNEVNDGVEQAQELADLTKNIRKLSYINLIPYNPVSEHDQYSRSTKERTLAFFDVLKKMVLTVSFVRNMVQILMLPVVNCAPIRSRKTVKSTCSYCSRKSKGRYSSMRTFFQADGNLTKLGRQICKTLAGAYALAIVLLCFLPQTWYPQYKDFSTQELFKLAVSLLPTPFNSIVNGDKVDSL